MSNEETGLKVLEKTLRTIIEGRQAEHAVDRIGAALALCDLKNEEVPGKVREVIHRAIRSRGVIVQNE